MNSTDLSERNVLIAFLACLASIVILVLVGAVLAFNGKGTEALGIAGAVTGLIGVIGTFKPRQAGNSTDNSKSVTNNTVASEPA